MKVGIFVGSANHDHYNRALKLFGQGVRQVGDACSIEKGTDYAECDVAVIFGSWKFDRAKTHKHHRVKKNVLTEHRALGRPFICLETPLLGREITEEHKYLRIGINGFLQDEAEFGMAGAPADRWEAVLSREPNVRVQPWRDQGRHIVVALQLPGDASLRGQCISQWAVDTVDELRRHTDRPIVIRPHKIIREYRMDLIHACLARHADVEFYDPGLSAGRDDLLGAWATVCYASSYAVDSLLAGIPCITMSPANMAWPVTGHSLGDIETPPMPDRMPWLWGLSYAQWTLPEMAQGLPWQHLRKFV